MDYTILQKRIKDLKAEAFSQVLSDARKNAEKRHYEDLYAAMRIMASEPPEDWEMMLNLEGISSVYVALVQQHLENLI